MDRRPTIMSMLSDEGKGGADRLALDLSVALRKRGHRVIWAAPGYCFLNDEARDSALEIFNPYPSGGLDLAGLPSLLRFCNEEKIDIINAHHSKGRHMLFRARLRGLRSKIVLTRHCIFDTIPLIGGFHYNLFADMNIAVSEAVRRSLLKSGILPSKIERIYGGVDASKFRAVSASRIDEARRRYCKEGYFTVGMVARLMHEGNLDPAVSLPKGHDVLFRAVAHLKKNISILLLGPWLEQDIKKLRLTAGYHGLDPSVLTFGGFQKDMAPYYRIMDMAVLPSLKEGLGLAIIEAMASGVPCIGADSGGISEIITHCKDGLLFVPGDYRDLAEKILTLIQDAALREKIALAGPETVAERFSIDTMASRTEFLFYELMA